MIYVTVFKDKISIIGPYPNSTSRFGNDIPNGLIIKDSDVYKITLNNTIVFQLPVANTIIEYKW